MNVTPVGVTFGYPRFKMPYKPAKNLRVLGPPKSMRDASPTEFTKLYTGYLDELGFEKVYAMLEEVWRTNGEKDLVLLCYEDVNAGQFCHRRVLAEWLESHTGEMIPELATERQPRLL